MLPKNTSYSQIHLEDKISNRYRRLMSLTPMNALGTKNLFNYNGS